MDFMYFIGIDVSKDSLQWDLVRLQAEVMDEREPPNEASEAIVLSGSGFECIR
ncbi:hypothetical protein [Fodinibius saliphilus]|uniref:hypothetical protein n=1 Tax=Fodinibius saliphilus TaxID=1920650 RepID=UPI001486CC9B|nr:hypothetical protein [Fodinibius saliphilus]